MAYRYNERLFRFLVNGQSGQATGEAPISYYKIAAAIAALRRGLPRQEGSSPEAEAALLAHRWPGNVRELENAVERAMVIGKGPTIRRGDLPLALDMDPPGDPAGLSLEAVEKEHIERVLSQHGGNVTQSAQVLGIDRATLYHKIKRYGLRR